MAADRIAAHPDATQYAALEAGSTMQAQPLVIHAQGRGTIAATFDLPRQGVALVTLDGPG